jgi:hypothetical protein
MAKKSKARVQRLSPRQPSSRKALPPRRWRPKLVIGGVVLVVVLGAGGLVRLLQQRDLAQHLQGTGERHYTLGTAGTPVVIKEFSDYT